MKDLKHSGTGRGSTTGQVEDIQVQLRINNAAGKLSGIILEPWGVEVEVNAGDRISLMASGPPGRAEIDQAIRDDMLIVGVGHGWMVAVSVNGRPVLTGSEAFPAL